MPLTKLFQRRNSSQKDRKKSLTSAELSASESVAEGSNTTKEPIAMNPESCYSEEKHKNSAACEETEKISNIEPELDDPNDESSDNTMPCETSRRCSVPETSDLMEQARIKSRSLSLKESGTKLNIQRTRRRKCESESAAFSSTDDEGFEDKIIQLSERDLEKVIGQCVDRLIRESILTAVKSVKVDSLYEDVIKSLSRSASESSESSGGPETVQQKLHTDSVTEYADLKMVHTFEEEKLEDEELDEADSPKQQRDSKASSEVSDKLQSDIQSENDNKDGTETEEGLTCPESDSTSKDKIADLKASFEADKSENCSNPVIEAESNVNDSIKSVENCESSTCQNQNENIVANVQVCGSDQLDTFVESDKSNIKNNDFQENDVPERTKEVQDCQENNISTEIVNENKQNETAEDTMDCSRQKEDHASHIENSEEVRELKDELADETDYIKTEVEEIKNISMEGYHADIEESISLHSMASESSFENIKDSKVYSRTISDDTVASVDESSLGGEHDTMLKKDTDDSLKSESGDAKAGKNLNVEADLMAMSGDDFSHLLRSESTVEESSTLAGDLGENLPEQKPVEEEKKVNWKVGYLHVKLPHKSRHKGLKVWKKRCVAIQPDEFANDDSDPCLVLSVYSGDSSAAKKHSASFWKSISCQKAVIYRSSSRTHPYAFTISDDKKAVIHLAADSEAITQEWMAAIRAILWPPSPVIQLEKMLNGREFEISIIDNEFSYHAGLLGMYGYLTITPKKLILVHPQQGFVIQEWYLNTIDKFQLIPQTRIEDVNKVLSMTTCSDSSTGKGDLMIFCKEAVSLLQAIASTIHQILTHHSKQEGGKYQKELEEIGAWLVADATVTEDYYKVPPRQVKSLLDIPNFIFNKPITPVATVVGTPSVAMDSQKSVLDVAKTEPTRASQDSGISSETVPDDFLNCSVTSFVVGGGRFPGKSSDSELSDTYTPPRSPEVKTRREAKASDGIAHA
ncbi:uncharacterized protein LOC129983984 [Argiope bruennichi]|uniref:uncharacterized protein LOC129983984 n=1 Tax=Argiope bruennichi TaxID=94029 RepID=UPI00249507D6|nr:uncharacterized protein LOC129983984 [Argiope bruennichi]